MVMFERWKVDNRAFDDQGAAFIWMWSVFSIFHLARRISETDLGYPGLLYVVATLCSIVTILNPRLIHVFLASVALGFVATLATMPVTSNHTFMRIFLMAGMLFSFLYIYIKHKHALRVTPGDFYVVFAPYGKAMLVIMYFYGVFHKINTDFLNPDTSCAVTLWELYPLPFGLADAVWVHYIAIYAALIIEAAIIVMLFIPRTKYWGLLLGLGFHFVLGINGYRFFVAFSSMTFALHFLFLPAGFLTRVRQGGIGRSMSSRRWAYPVVVLGLLGVYAGVLGFGWMSFYYATLSLFIVVSVAILVAVALYGQSGTVRRADTWRGLHSPSPVLYLLGIAFFINGAMPYLGLKTEQSLNMFSNLYTERGETNHLVITEPFYLADFQNDVVRIMRTNEPYFADVRDEGLLIPWFEFRRMISQTPMEYRRFLMLEYMRDGEIHVITPEYVSQAGVVEPLSAWLEDWFHFRYITTIRPQVCGGHKLPEGRDAIDKDRMLFQFSGK